MPRGTYKPEVVVETDKLTEEEWLEYRRGGIGGSDVSIIYGVSHFRTCRELYYDKLKIKPYREEEDSTWLQKKMGHVLEELVAEVFAKKTGLKVYEVKKMFYHPLYPFMRADVDRFVVTKDGKMGILECKTTNWQNRDAWADEKYPYQYELQVRHYLAVMNLDFAYIACLWGNNENDFAYRYIERDYEFEDEIIEMEQSFWEENVQKKIEPPFVEKPDMPTSSRAALLALWYTKRFTVCHLQTIVQNFREYRPLYFGKRVAGNSRTLKDCLNRTVSHRNTTIFRTKHKLRSVQGVGNNLLLVQFPVFVHQFISLRRIAQ